MPRWSRSCPSLGVLRLALPLALVATLFSAVARADDGVATNREVTVIPFVGGDSDIGWGLGFIAGLADVPTSGTTTEFPYLWRLEASGFATFKLSPFSAPYQDHYLLLTVPRLFGRKIRLDARASFTSEATLTYFGVGDASVQNDAAYDANPYKYQYGWIHPTLWVRARFPVAPSLYMVLGNEYTQSWLDIHPGSVLAADIASKNPDVRSALGQVVPDHATDGFEYALIYDTRNDETAPTLGGYHQLDVRFYPGGTGSIPYRFASVDLMGRIYQKLDPKRVVFAARGVIDSKFGDPPFYELARFLDTPAVGGSGGVRGVPGYRYYGKAKVFTNLEVRTLFAEFPLFGEPVRLHAVGFLDVGRVWSDYHAAPELDGLGLGLKYGVGIGVRFQRGSSFVLRGDSRVVTRRTTHRRLPRVGSHVLTTSGGQNGLAHGDSARRGVIALARRARRETGAARMSRERGYRGRGHWRCFVPPPSGAAAPREE